MSAPETDGFKCDVSAYHAPVVIELGDDGEHGVAKRLYEESREREGRGIRDVLMRAEDEFVLERGASVSV